jgi:hypothetical protein
MPLALFRVFFPKLVAVLPDAKQRSVLARLHALGARAAAHRRASRPGSTRLVRHLRWGPKPKL